MYTVIGLNGIQYGPVDIQTLQDWATQGRVLPGTLVTDLATGRQSAANQLFALQPIFSRPPSMQTMMGNGPSPSFPVHGHHGNIVPQTNMSAHSPIAAVLLSLLITGLGQIYNKQIAKGILALVLAIILAVCTWGISILFTWIFVGIDAGLIAGRLQRGETVTEWQCF